MEIPKQIPPDSYGLIQELTELNPPRCFDPQTETEAQHQRHAGVCELLHLLNEKLEAEARRNQRK